MDIGYSRIPVYHGSNKTDIVGILLVKELIVVCLVSPPPLVKPPCPCIQITYKNNDGGSEAVANDDVCGMVY